MKLNVRSASGWICPGALLDLPAARKKNKQKKNCFLHSSLRLMHHASLPFRRAVCHSFPWRPGFLLLKKCSGGSRPEGKSREGAAQALARGPCKESSRMVQDIWSPPSSGFLQERARPSCTSSTRRFPLSRQMSVFSCWRAHFHYLPWPVLTLILMAVGIAPFPGLRHPQINGRNSPYITLPHITHGTRTSREQRTAGAPETVKGDKET